MFILPFRFVLFIFFHQPIKDAAIIPKEGRKQTYLQPFTAFKTYLFTFSCMCGGLEGRYALLIITND